MGDVNSCGKKWKLGSSSARVAADGTVAVEVSGLVLDDVSVGDANGTADGVDAIAVAVLCDGKVAAQAEPTPLSKQGAAKFAGKLAVPQNCASPMVVVRERYEGKIGGWLAGARSMICMTATRKAESSSRPNYPFVGAAESRSLADLRSDHRLAGISTVASWTFDLTSSGFTAPKHDGDDSGMAKRKLDRRLAQGDLVLFADLLDRLHLLHYPLGERPRS